MEGPWEQYAQKGPWDLYPAAQPNDNALRDHFNGVLTDAVAANKGPEGEAKPFGFKDAVEAGWQQSVMGLQQRGQLPDKVLPEDAGMMKRIVSSVASLAGDAPSMIEGFGLGFAAGVPAGPAAPFTGMGGAFALPAALRKGLIESYTKGEIKSGADFVGRAAGVFLDAAKGFVTGVATEGAGVIAGKAVGTTAPTRVKNAAVGASEIGAMVTVSKGLEGKVPDLQDFTDAAVLIFGMKAAGFGAAKLQNIYVKTGKTPDQVFADIQRDPATKADLLSTTAIPRSYNAIIDPAYRQNDTALVIPTPPKKADDVQAAQDNILSKVRIGEEKPSKPMTFTDFYTKAVDDLYPIRAEVNKMGFTGLEPLHDPYVLARLTKGNFGRAEQFLFYKPYEFGSYKNMNVKSLADAVEPVKHDLDGFRAFIVAKRAIELEGRGIQSGFDLNDANAVVKAGSKEFQQAQKDVVAYQDALTQHLRDSGVIDHATYDLITEANKQYVPFYRFMEDQTGGGAGVLPEGLQAKKPIKNIKGSGRDVIDPLESIVKNTYAYISLAERNAVNRKFVYLAMKSKTPDAFVKKVPTKIVPVTVMTEEMARHIRDSGNTATINAKTTTLPAKQGEAANTGDQIKVEYNPDLLADLPIFRALREPLKSNEIAVFENGQRQVYEIQNPDVAAAFKGTDKEMSNFLMRLIAAPNKIFRAGTTLSPDFMPRNMIRDQIDAYINSRTGFIPVVDTIAGVSHLLKKDNLYQDWLKSGGANATFVALDSRYIQHNISRIAEDRSLAGFIEETKNDPMSLVHLPWNTVTTAVDILRMTSELAENATRLGEFKRSLKGGTSKADILNSGYQSREVTLDFARAGVRVRAANQIIAFINAQIQGVDRIGRAFKENPLGTSAKIGAIVTLPTVMLWWANHDDPRWKEIPDWQRDNFWIVMTDDWREPKAGDVIPQQDGMSRTENGKTVYNFGNMFRIPKPHETGVLFGSSIERFLDWSHDHDPKAIEAFGSDVVAAFAPSVVPTIAAPVVEQFANKSMFTGNPLVPPAAEELLPEYQYTPYTTELTKALGHMLGYVPYIKDTTMASPAIVENYIRQWSGGLGMYAIQIADKGLREAGVLPDPAKPEPTLADIPFIKAFAVRYPSAGAQSIRNFYDQYDKNKRILNTVQKLAKDGDIEASMKLANANPMAMATLDGVQQGLTNMQHFVQLVYKNPDIKPQEKRQLIDTTYYQMIQTAQMGNQVLKQLAAQLQNSGDKPQ